MERVVILGAGGHAREVLDVLEALNRTKPRFKILGFIVDPGYGEEGRLVNELPILGGFGWLEGRGGELRVISGVGNSALRRRLVEQARGYRIGFISAVHPFSSVTDRVRIGEGVVIAPGCVVTNQIEIGDHVLVNMGSTVGHDTVLEDYATISPGASVSGNVTIEEGGYVGAGARIVERRRVGAWSIVGAGAVVTQDVPPNTTAVGVPARVVTTRPSGWQLERV